MRKRLGRILISAFSVMICTAYLGCGGGGGTSGGSGSTTTTTVTTTTTTSGTSASTSTSTTTTTTTVATTTTTTVPPTTAAGKLPDTGQTADFTATFGEDSDYTINPPSFTAHGDGTVTDNVTGLVWQRTDDGTTRTWADAGTYCDNLTLGGYTDWRLPTVKELTDIVNYGTYNPAIDTTAFTGTHSSNYWSSTSDANYSSYAWYVYFDYGLVYSYSKTSYYYVRCVRGGQ